MKPRSLFITLLSVVKLVFYISIISLCFVAVSPCSSVSRCLFCFHLVRLKSFSLKQQQQKSGCELQKAVWLLFVLPQWNDHRPSVETASQASALRRDVTPRPSTASVHVTETRKWRRVLTWKWYLTGSWWAGASVADLVWIRSRGKSQRLDQNFRTSPLELLELAALTFRYLVCLTFWI